MALCKNMFYLIRTASIKEHAKKKKKTTFSVKVCVVQLIENATSASLLKLIFLFLTASLL